MTLHKATIELRSVGRPASCQIVHDGEAWYIQRTFITRKNVLGPLQRTPTQRFGRLATVRWQDVLAAERQRRTRQSKRIVDVIGRMLRLKFRSFRRTASSSTLQAKPAKRRKLNDDDDSAMTWPRLLLQSLRYFASQSTVRPVCVTYADIYAYLVPQRTGGVRVQNTGKWYFPTARTPKSTIRRNMADLMRHHVITFAAPGVYHYTPVSEANPGTDGSGVSEANPASGVSEANPGTDEEEEAPEPPKVSHISFHHLSVPCLHCLTCSSPL